MIHVVDEDAIVEAEQVAGVVHAILLDSGNPTLETEELGGTGRRHDWAVSARIRERVDVPVFLAGGLAAASAALLSACGGTPAETRPGPSPQSVQQIIESAPLETPVLVRGRATPLGATGFVLYD